MFLKNQRTVGEEYFPRASSFAPHALLSVSALTVIVILETNAFPTAKNLVTCAPGVSSGDAQCGEQAAGRQFAPLWHTSSSITA